MKIVKILFSVLSFLAISAIFAVTFLTVWANKPRGIKIDISKLNSDY